MCPELPRKLQGPEEVGPELQQEEQQGPEVQQEEQQGPELQQQGPEEVGPEVQQEEQQGPEVQQEEQQGPEELGPAQGQLAQQRRLAGSHQRRSACPEQQLHRLPTPDCRSMGSESIQQAWCSLPGAGYRSQCAGASPRFRFQSWSDGKQRNFVLRTLCTSTRCSHCRG